ncbi:MAG: hypothetical protein WDO12_03310 [Pseudomonadota bacterium]
MTYVDGSASGKANIELASSDSLKRKDGSSYLNIQLNRVDGQGVGATNLGLPGHQVALGFNSGNDQKDAVRFNGDVLARIGKYWSVSTVPADEGAKPMTGCE